MSQTAYPSDYQKQKDAKALGNLIQSRQRNLSSEAKENTFKCIFKLALREGHFSSGRTF